MVFWHQFVLDGKTFGDERLQTPQIAITNSMFLQFQDGIEQILRA
jgi:hypothetical protein